MTRAFVALALVVAIGMFAPAAASRLLVGVSTDDTKFFESHSNIALVKSVATQINAILFPAGLLKRQPTVADFVLTHRLPDCTRAANDCIAVEVIAVAVGNEKRLALARVELKDAASGRIYDPLDPGVAAGELAIAAALALAKVSWIQEWGECGLVRVSTFNSNVYPVCTNRAVWSRAGKIADCFLTFQSMFDLAGLSDLVSIDKRLFAGVRPQHVLLSSGSLSQVSFEIIRRAEGAVATEWKGSVLIALVDGTCEFQARNASDVQWTQLPSQLRFLMPVSACITDPDWKFLGLVVALSQPGGRFVAHCDAGTVAATPVEQVASIDVSATFTGSHACMTEKQILMTCKRDQLPNTRFSIVSLVISVPSDMMLAATDRALGLRYNGQVCEFALGAGVFNCALQNPEKLAADNLCERLPRPVVVGCPQPAASPGTIANPPQQDRDEIRSP